MLVENKLFLIDEYEKKSVFSSFLPGINGRRGIPLWCFYVNRGQCITSFGTMDKEHSIMEFYPAHQAYQRTQEMGFRTFLKIDGICHEAFTSHASKKRMRIGKNELCIEEMDEINQISMKVRYTTLPDESLGALMRNVEITNMADESRKIEVLDGMAEVVPYGVSLESMKEMAQTAKAWMEVLDHEKGTPRFKVRASMKDTAQVSRVEGFHFAMAVSKVSKEKEVLPVIVSKETVFGYDTALKEPICFYEQSSRSLSEEKQMTQNEVPCCFFAAEKEMGLGESIILQEIYGMSQEKLQWNQLVEQMKTDNYFEQKQNQARKLAQELTDTIATKTGHPIFDEYCRQSYLDNLLRGGCPIQIGKHIFYVYSRKHGDIERDYNFFTMYPESYSQGNGNFRDVNQNRRCDVEFAPFVEDKNIKYFYNCIQTNGYNPLGIEKSVYQILDGRYSDIVSGMFTPGELYEKLRRTERDNKRLDEKFVEIMNEAEALNETKFLEGYWTDHWTYNLDLVENYLCVYPEREGHLLFEDETYTYRQSEAAILPRRERYVYTENGIRQYNFLKKLKAEEKIVLDDNKNKVTATLAEKLFLLCVLKTAAMDPYGMGIEMEGGKPGWYDALNGLPGLIGSSVAEVYELERMLTFLLEKVQQHKREIKVFEELWELTEAMYVVICEQKSEWKADGSNMICWNKINDLKEKYWEQTQTGIKGSHKKVSWESCYQMLDAMRQFVHCGIEKAIACADGLAPTYFYYDVIAYEENDGICPLEFKQHDVPAFLEGPVRALKLKQTRQEKEKLYQKVKESNLYDKKLHMYKVNESLGDASFELGRAKAFTPGWLENESIWLHMEYKYLLELLKSEMYERFEEDFMRAAVPFLKEETYGRSLLENSSFIVSSNNPNSSIHGKGFVARLSGSTAEFLQIWQILMFGSHPFIQKNEELCLDFTPMIPSYLIGEDKQIQARFLGVTDVVYQLPDMNSLLPGSYQKKAYAIIWEDGTKEKIEKITGETAKRIREGQAKKILVTLTR